MTALWVAFGRRRGTRRGCGSIRWRVEADDRIGRTNLWEMGVSSSRGSKECLARRGGFCCLWDTMKVAVVMESRGRRLNYYGLVLPVLVAAEGRDLMRQACWGADVRDLEVKVGKLALEFSSDGANKNNTIEILALPAQVGGCKQAGQVGGGGEMAVGRGVRRGEMRKMVKAREESGRMAAVAFET